MNNTFGLQLYSDAKSCILVTTCCENVLLFENYGQEVGGTNTIKVRDQFSPVPTVVASMSGTHFMDGSPRGMGG